MAVVNGMGLTLCASSVYQVSSSYAFPLGRYDALLVSILGGLVSLTFDLLTLKLEREIACKVDNHPTNWVFLGRFILDLSPLSANTCQTRHVPLRP